MTIVFGESEVPAIAAERSRWDPVMAAGVPPHVTLVYPEEFNDEALLIERAQVITTRFGPFSMQVGEVFVDGDDGSAGVFCTVLDPTSSWSRLRDFLLRPPFKAVDVAPHITIVHPRTSNQGAEAWSELEGSDFCSTLEARELCLTSTDRSAGMKVRQRFVLTGGRAIAEPTSLDPQSELEVPAFVPERRERKGSRPNQSIPE